MGDGIMNPKGEQAADDFLREFEVARKAMRRAAAQMLACSKLAVVPEARVRYDAAHKQMVRLIREWNKLEETREHPAAALQQTAPATDAPSPVERSVPDDLV